MSPSFYLTHKFSHSLSPCSFRRRLYFSLSRISTHTTQKFILLTSVGDFISTSSFSSQLDLIHHIESAGVCTLLLIHRHCKILVGIFTVSTSIYIFKRNFASFQKYRKQARRGKRASKQAGVTRIMNWILSVAIFHFILSTQSCGAYTMLFHCP